MTTPAPVPWDGTQSQTRSKRVGSAIVRWAAGWAIGWAMGGTQGL
jgi:hypothetical protein